MRQDADTAEVQETGAIKRKDAANARDNYPEACLCLPLARRSSSMPACMRVWKQPHVVLRVLVTSAVPVAVSWELALAPRAAGAAAAFAALTGLCAQH